MSINIIETHMGSENHFIGLSQKLNKVSSNNLLNAYREQASRRFSELKFPSRKDEMFSYVDTRELASIPFDINSKELEDIDTIIQENKFHLDVENIIVIQNNNYLENKSRISSIKDKISVKSFSNALEDDELQKYLFGLINREHDVFASLNYSLIQDGLFIDILPDSKIDNPIQLIILSNSDENHATITCPNVFLRLGHHSEVNISVNTIGSGKNYFHNYLLNVVLYENAHLNYHYIQGAGNHSWHFTKLNATLYKDSRFNSVYASTGGKIVRHHYDAHLIEDGADFNINGISVLKDQEQVHNYVRVHHQAPNCNSNQTFRNIILDKAHSSVDTTVVVHEGAQQTKSAQLINNLMLSEDGRADTKPNLMIYADDVKCSHGATVGQIQEDQLFYLKSRGLTEQDARALLTSSFAKSIIERIDHKEVIQKVNGLLISKLEACNG